MGLFSKKVDSLTAMKFNYFISFEYIPKMLHGYLNDKNSFEAAISYDWMAKNHPEYAPLIKQIEVRKSGYDEHPDIEIYYVKLPPIKFPAAVAMGLIAVNRKTQGYLFYTLEHSFGGYAICNPDEDGNHGNTGIVVQNGSEFLEYCLEWVNKFLTGNCFAHF